MYGGLVRAVHLRNTDEIILKKLLYLGMTKELEGDSFVLWQRQKYFVYKKAFKKSFLFWIHQNVFNEAFLTEDTDQNLRDYQKIAKNATKWS